MRSQCEGAGATTQGDCKTPEASDPAEGKEKRRGKRRRGHTTTEIWCVNTSGKPQLEKTIGAAAGMREQGTHVVAVLNQEHQQGKDRIQDLQAWAKQRGWSLTAAPAVTTDKGGQSVGRGHHDATRRASRRDGRVQGRLGDCRVARTCGSELDPTSCTWWDYVCLGLLVAH